jgi:hypothetical protein
MNKVKKQIFLTFSSKESVYSDKDIAMIIKTIDKNSNLQITNRWFEKKKFKEVDIKIYENSIKSLLSSDLIIAEVSTSSIGVGQQIAFGMFYKIPVLILAKKEIEKARHSLFIKGTRSTQVSFYYYENTDDIVKNLNHLIKSKFDDNYEKLNFMATKSIKKTLEIESRKRGISQSELLRQIIIRWKESE